MTAHPKRKAVIIGGSMAGLFAGHFLRHAGWQVDIFERTAGPLSARGAGIMTHPELRAALAAVGLEPGSDFGVPLETRVALERDDHVIASRHCPQVSASWTRVYTMLIDAFASANFHSGVDFVAFEQHTSGVTAHFTNGRSETADLLIGADGLRSTVRRSLFPQLAPTYAGYVAWRGLLSEVDIDHPPYIRSSLFSFNLPSGEHMVGYPVAGADGDLRPGHRRYNFVWYKPADAEGELPGLLTDSSAKLHELSIPPNLITAPVIDAMRVHATRVLAPWFQTVVASTPRPFLQPIYDLAVPHMTAGRVALIGDAAFVVRPHVGAGVLKAAEDAQALAGALARDDDIDTALQAFSINRHKIGNLMINRARWLGSYLRYSYSSDAERAAAAQIANPAAVLAETAMLDFLHAKT